MHPGLRKAFASTTMALPYIPPATMEPTYISLLWGSHTFLRYYGLPLHFITMEPPYIFFLHSLI